MLRTNRKSQVLTQDFILSIIIFSAALLLIFQLLEIPYERKSWLEANEIVVQDFMRKIDYIVRNPGIPVNWDRNNIVILGFADSDHVLNLTKFMIFKNMNYSQQKNLLGVGGDEFYIALENSTGQILQFENKLLYAGKLPNKNINFIIATKRYVYITNGSEKIPAIFEGCIWK